MTRKSGFLSRQILFCLLIFGVIVGISTVAIGANLPNVTVMGVAPDGSQAAIAQYRWLLELDKTYHVQTKADGTANPLVFDPNWGQLDDGKEGGQTLSVGFHQSYMPVVGKGCVGFEDLIGGGDTIPVQ